MFTSNNLVESSHCPPKTRWKNPSYIFEKLLNLRTPMTPKKGRKRNQKKNSPLVVKKKQPAMSHLTPSRFRRLGQSQNICDRSISGCMFSMKFVSCCTCGTSLVQQRTYKDKVMTWKLAKKSSMKMLKRDFYRRYIYIYVCVSVCVYLLYLYIYMCVCVCLIFFHIHILLSWEQKEPKERLVMRPYSGPKSLNPVQRSQGQEPNLYWTFSPGKSMFTPLKINTTLENPPVSNMRYIFIHGGFFHWSS